MEPVNSRRMGCPDRFITHSLALALALAHGRELRLQVRSNVFCPELCLASTDSRANSLKCDMVVVSVALGRLYHII